MKKLIGCRADVEVAQNRRESGSLCYVQSVLIAERITAVCTGESISQSPSLAAGARTPRLMVSELGI